MVQTDSSRILEAFPEGEHREFLVEMLVPEMDEGQLTLEDHQAEELFDVDDIEAFSNNMGRQKRRMAFIRELHTILERSNSD